MTETGRRRDVPLVGRCCDVSVRWGHVHRGGVVVAGQPTCHEERAGETVSGRMAALKVTEGSTLERALAWQIAADPSIPVPVRELVFAKPRRFRFDFAWPDRKLAVEVDGGTWSSGRHTRGAGYRADVDKHNLAVANGWRVLRFTAEHVNNGTALSLIAQLVGKEAA